MEGFESIIRTIRKNKLDIDEAYSMAFSNHHVMRDDIKKYPLTTKVLGDALVFAYGGSR